MDIRQADAFPEKSLFLEMFTRDLRLEDCILDLVDNSIDGLIKSRGIDVSEALIPVASSESEETIEPSPPPANINITCNSRMFKIEDNCGGISVEDATKEVFKFGHSKDARPGQLGVYGIGLKRAIFKIGKLITIVSKTVEDGFRMNIDVPNWSDNTSWNLPFEVTEGTGDLTEAGTSITIKSFSPEIAGRFNSGTFETNLKGMIARTYSLFLRKFVIVTFNGSEIEPNFAPLGSSDQANVAKEEFQDRDVKVTIYVGLSARDSDGRWKAADAGWYIACNGRLVVTADKDERTGWGGGGMPTFVPKYRGFIGLVFFYSTNPLSLPWTTTKQGINQESLVFQRTRTRMAILGRPVLSFLDDMYSSSQDDIEKESQRLVAASVRPKDIRDLTNEPQVRFSTTARPPEEVSHRVQYNAKQVELNRVRKALRKSDWSAAKLGRYTFDHFLKKECPE